MTNFSLLLLLFSVFVLTLVVADDLKLGNTSNAQLVFVENVKLSGIPLKTRTKNVWYNDESPTPKAIKAVTAIDLENSNAKAIVTAGGVGYTFVNIRLKSEKGEGFEYQIQVFV